MLDAAIIAAIVEAVGAVGSSAMLKKRILLLTHLQFLIGRILVKIIKVVRLITKVAFAYEFMSSHFKKPPAGVPEDRKVYDDDGRLLGWFAVGGPAKTGFEAKGFARRKRHGRWLR